eukprot:12299805-Heterocapsa_arctica.AAC.1
MSGSAPFAEIFGAPSTASPSENNMSLALSGSDGAYKTGSEGSDQALARPPLRALPAPATTPSDPSHSAGHMDQEAYVAFATQIICESDSESGLPAVLG